MLSGRTSQIIDVINAVSQEGQHAAIYGERGVGKTSLANVLSELFDSQGLPHYQSALVNCASEDNYTMVWQNVFRELRLSIDDHPSPEMVRRALTDLDPPALVIIDELDRFEDNEGLTLMADTIKTLSDHVVASTVVFVGVADSVEELMGEHESISRALLQVEMPRMSRSELHLILERGCERSGLTVREAASDRITSLAEGLPHYVHLLGLHAGQYVVQNDRTEIMPGDVSAIIPQAVERHTIQSKYLRATESPRQQNLFPQVLLAAALAPKNQLGYFTAGALREPLQEITGRRIDIPAFARHLSEFLELERGAVLRRYGFPRRYTYRFSDPIFQPYVILRSLTDGLISNAQLAKIQGSQNVDEAASETSEPPQLF
jgi:energy-coupling factor transporter ATP-binding protein EcfA2